MSHLRRDVSWSIKFRLARTGVWAEWSGGHRSTQEAVSWAEGLAAIDAVADIRFERVTVEREVFTLHEISEKNL